LAALNDLPRLLATANIEGRKEFVRAFIGGMTIRPDTAVLDVQMKKFPALGKENFTCEMVAGARYEPVQIELKPWGGSWQGCGGRRSPSDAGIEPASRFKRKERWCATFRDSGPSIRCHVPISSPLESPRVPWSPLQSWRQFGDGLTVSVHGPAEGAALDSW